MEIVQNLLTKVGIVSKPQMKALTTLFATILIACSKVNFTVVLFSTDLTQSAAQIYHFYKLRFQIEVLLHHPKTL
ncbi:hypothetical protein C7B65_08230 [Phormidesmis priestleyi ULC007]|uniref:Uncharacterized protein n=1 Tax=Phormidesmis priestleyi ULC007 TaxID=1920490 RepID=A0A2T1DIW7_9CYAN|nr:hypothetical protein [Phormidesmis priestleyi]PSB20413.1 hypothetical protein C7B65_08230 [Phormidesmis priestleyi ULC007]PZO52989.1 MAG: hypothetical protein DCF14_05060 [Phormidesmis priestleyi]